MIRHVQQKKMFHKHNVWEHEAETSHNAEQGHLERQIYAVQNYIHQEEGGCGVHGHTHIEAIKMRAGLGYSLQINGFRLLII